MFAFTEAFWHDDTHSVDMDSQALAGFSTVNPIYPPQGPGLDL